MAKVAAATARVRARRKCSSRTGLVLRLIVPIAVVGYSSAAAYACGGPPGGSSKTTAHTAVAPAASTAPPAVAQSVAPVSGGPNRAGFCDRSGRFYNLIPGQENEAPWSSLGLRPADVTAGGAIYCAAQASEAPASAAQPAAPVVTPAAPAQPQKPARKVTPKAPKSKHRSKHKAVPKHHGIEHRPGRKTTLPFTP